MGAASGGPDRRILAAFYTQYVAVLLILVTCTVGLIAAAPPVPPDSAQEHVDEGLPPATPLKEAATLSRSDLRGLFLDDGRVAGENPELLAIAAVLRAHDVTAVVHLTVPRLAVDAGPSSFQRALRRITALESFFAQQRVPHDAFRIVVRERGGNPSDAEVELQGAIVELGRGHHVDS